MAAHDRSMILPYQLEPTSTVADSESDTTNSDYSSDSDSSAAMSTDNVVYILEGNTDWCKCHCCATDCLIRPNKYVCCQEKRVWRVANFMPYTTRKVRDISCYVTIIFGDYYSS